jgi:probable rRNA maturation factor
MELILQQVVEVEGLPDEAQFERWARAAIEHVGEEVLGELVVRIVDESESAQLNQQYRNRQGATNVLSFPFEAPAGIPLEELPLGDLVISAPVIAREAQEQGKSPHAHWAHMVVHGVLHLLGMDHIEPHDAVVMERAEIETLALLGFPDPYA